MPHVTQLLLGIDIKEQGGAQGTGDCLIDCVNCHCT
jgi:hypothetical protein